MRGRVERAETDSYRQWHEFCIVLEVSMEFIPILIYIAAKTFSAFAALLGR